MCRALLGRLTALFSSSRRGGPAHFTAGHLEGTHGATENCPMGITAAARRVKNKRRRRDLKRFKSERVLWMRRWFQYNYAVNTIYTTYFIVLILRIRQLMMMLL